MIRLHFFSLLLQVALDQPSEVGRGLLLVHNYSSGGGLEEPYGVAFSFEELGEDPLGQRVSAEDGYGARCCW
jgi:hypothetical protein